MTDRLLAAVTSAPELLARPVRSRCWLVPQAVPHPSLGMLYGPRGEGKTWAALDLSLAIASRSAWGPYEAPESEHTEVEWDGERERWPLPRRVFYVDGEMALAELQERLAFLGRGRSLSELFILPSEDLPELNLDVDLAREGSRGEMNAVVEDLRPDVVVLDNWASLIRGLDEDRNAELGPVMDWLVGLRHAGRSVLMVHHSGKDASKGQRGASAREGPLDYSLAVQLLDRSAEEARFQLSWDKQRGALPDPATWTMQLDPSGLRFLDLQKQAEKRHKSFLELFRAGPLSRAELTRQSLAAGLSREGYPRRAQRLSGEGILTSWVENGERFYGFPRGKKGPRG